MDPIITTQGLVTEDRYKDEAEEIAQETISLLLSSLKTGYQDPQETIKIIERSINIAGFSEKEVEGIKENVNDFKRAASKMINCECDELIRLYQTVHDAEIRINEEIMKRERMLEEIKRKKLLTERDIELLDNVLPAEIGCLKSCRENLQKKRV